MRPASAPAALTTTGADTWPACASTTPSTRPAATRDADHLVGDELRAGLDRRGPQAEQHLARVGIAVFRPEQSPPDVVEHQPGHQGRDLVDAEPALHRAGRVLGVGPGGKRRAGGVVGEEQVAALAEPGPGRVRRRAHPLVEVAPQLDAVLHHPHAHRRAELLADAAHGEERRRARVGGIALDDDDPPGEAVALQPPGRRGPDHAAADDDDVGGARRGHRRAPGLTAPPA